MNGWTEGKISSVAFLKRYRNRLDLLAEEVLGLYLWSKQREILRSITTHRRTVVPSGHAVGKTFTAAVATIAFLLAHPNSKVVTTAPTWQQVSLQLWSKINALVAEKLPKFGGDPLQTHLRVGHEWFATGLSPKYQTNFQGYHAPSVLVILDEAPGVRREIYDGADTLMSAGDAHMLMIGNPTDSYGFFYEACQGRKSNAWNVVPISCLDSPNFTEEAAKTPPEVLRELVGPEWVEEMRDEWGEDNPLFRAKVLGRFPDSASNSVIPLSWYEAAEQRWMDLLEKPDMGGAGADIHLGVDVAWEGDDRSVLMLRLGQRIEMIAEYQGMDPIELSNVVYQKIEEYGVKVCAIDAIGIGSGTYARLLERQREGKLYRMKIASIKASERADNPDKFPNRRSEMWWHLREAIHPDRGWLALDPSDTRLKSEVTQAVYRIDSGSRIEVERKDKMKIRLGRSPDRADGLMFAVACSRWADMRPVMNEYLASGRGGRRVAAVPTLTGGMAGMP